MNKIMRLMLLLVVGSATAMIGVRAVAQADPDAAAAPRAGANATPDQVMAFMTKRLALTDDQRDKITPIVADRQEQLKTLRADTSERPMQRMRKAKSVQETADKKIKAILTKDQAKQYDAMEEQMKDAAKQRQQAKKDAQ